MNDIRKTIGWADYSWNPIKGECPVKCWYCYERRRKQRLKLDKTVRLDEKELFAPANRWGKRNAIFDGAKRIFVCSIFDLFAPVADKYRDLIFESIQMDTADTFIILTKLPARIDRPMPKNVWMGVSAENQQDALGRFTILLGGPAGGDDGCVRFISYEPMLEPLHIGELPKVDWLILGRLTGHGKKYDPPKESLLNIYNDCEEEKIPLFMKSNLAGIWKGKLIQEWPENGIVPKEG